MPKKTDNKKKEGQEEYLPGYKHYPQEEDIFQQNVVEGDIDPEQISKTKTEVKDSPNEKNFEDDVSGSDLDIPGAELDDDMEEIGSEDEENNHYSLGGDDKENLEEDKGEDLR